jgi:Ca2+-binding RTX toxin-like protein
MRGRRGFALSVASMMVVVVVMVLGGLAAQAQSATVVMGTPEDDQIAGMVGPQIIHGRGGDDRINGGKGPDVLYGGPGNDNLTTGKGGATEAAYGGRGKDLLKDYASGQSPGLLAGGPGRDRCIGDKHDTFRSCEVVRLRPHWE